MSKHKLLVGASIPVGVQAVKDFEAMKLGEIALLTLPDDIQEATEVMRYCREKKIYVMLSEIVHRGGDERWHCPSIDKETFNKILKEAGEYYLGRYVIGEAGGIIYWPKEYTINRAVNNYTNLPPAKDVIDAHKKYVEYMNGYIEREKKDIADGPFLNVDSSMLFKYQAEAGIDHLCLELFPGTPLRMLPAIRGCARAMDKFWGVHIAIGCYGSFEFDELWMKRWKQSLYLCYLYGSEFIFPESGYYSFSYGNVSFPFNSPTMREARRVLREFYRFHKVHERPGNEPKTPLAIMFGQEDGCPGLWNKYAWGQYESGNAWKDSDAEHSWNMTEILNKREDAFSAVVLGKNSFSGNPPCGQYDILPAEAPVEVLSKYRDIVFIGYNLMTDELYKHLVDYVRQGGNLLMWLPHCNINPTRGGAIEIYNRGDLSELFGIKVLGKRPPDVVGVKTFDNSTLPLPQRGIRRDPVMFGNITGACIEVTSKDTVISAGFTGIHDISAEELAAHPALVEHKIGKGVARLVPAFDYPATPGMQEWASHLIRIVSLSGQGSTRLLCSDSVRYSIYSKNDYEVIYALNTEYDISQNIRVMLNGNLTGEFSVSPSTMGILFAKNGIVIHPQFPETSLDAWKDEDATVSCLFEQDLELANTASAPATIRINGKALNIPAASTIKLHIPPTQGTISDEFFAPDYLEEPFLNPKNIRLPY